MQKPKDLKFWQLIPHNLSSPVPLSRLDQTNRKGQGTRSTLIGDFINKTSINKLLTN